jgi:transcriptional regulator with XRE-family HTH domain
MTEQELTTAKIKFGKSLKKIREGKKLSYRQVAANCSLTHSRIQEIESGQYNITLGTIIELAKGLEVTPSKLLDY